METDGAMETGEMMNFLDKRPQRPHPGIHQGQSKVNPRSIQGLSKVNTTKTTPKGGAVQAARGKEYVAPRQYWSVSAVDWSVLLFHCATTPTCMRVLWKSTVRMLSSGHSSDPLHPFFTISRPHPSPPSPPHSPHLHPS